MLQQPSEFIMYQTLPLDLNMHSSEVSNLQPDFKEIGLQMQAQRAAATQAFFFDTYSMKASVPSPAPMGAGMYEYPVHAMYDPLRHHRLQNHHHQQQHQQPNEHHHHQQLQHQFFAPMAVAGSMGSWQQQQQLQQESRGCWFPNWQEVFHGFVAAKEGQQQQQKQGMPPPFQQQPLQQGAIVAPPVAIMSAAISVAEAQRPCGGSDGAQALDPRPLTPPRLHHTAAPLPYSAPKIEKKRDDNLVITPHAAVGGAQASATETRQPDVHSGGAQSNDPSTPHAAVAGAQASAAEAQQLDVHSGGAQSSDPSPLLPDYSRPATALLPYLAPEAERRRESNLVPCVDLKNPPSPPTMDAIAFKYTTQSPSWLPEGWITEVQTRRTGTTAGTRDKYYKDLMSGRRFRSRNEVMHFLETGKGRLRKRRRKKAIASSAFGGSQNFLANQPHSLGQDVTSSPCHFLAPRPIGFLLGPVVNTHPLQNGLNRSSMPAVMAEEVEAPCQTSDVFPTTSSVREVMLGLKRPVEVRPQKMPVFKKTKTMSPKKCEDKQASRLWQWLQKPARTDEQTQKQDVSKQSNVDGEKNTAEMKDQRDAEDSDRELRVGCRTAQLSREIEAAQRTVEHLGKEMQETVEKLTRKIQAAQKDIQLETQAAHRTDDAMGSVIQAAQNLDSAMGNVSQATQNLVVAMGNAVQAMQLPDVNVGSASPAAKQPQTAVASAIQRAPRPDVAMAQSASRGYTTQAAERPDLAMGYFMQAHRMTGGVMGYASEAAQRPYIARGYITQPAQMPDVTMRYSIQAARMPDGAMFNQAQALQSPVLVMGYASTQAGHRPDVAMGIADVTDAPPINAERLSRDMHAYQKAVELSKQIVEARNRHFRKFAALNPKLDLSLLSPSLSSRQRAKAVQKMKAKHSRGLLVILGRKLCYKALRKAAVSMS